MMPLPPRLARWLQRTPYRLSRAASWLHGRNPDEAPGPPLDDYVGGLPTAQNAIDILPGWRHALPPHLGVRAGPAGLHDDTRIRWAIAQSGPLQGRKILELEPLEAANTAMLEQQAPNFIHAITTDRSAYLRCLVVKELLGLKRATFLLGDSVPWLQTTETRYDLIVASGVLHRTPHPLPLLELIAARCDAFYLWTRCGDETAMPPGNPPCWIEKEALLDAIRALGFSDLRVAHDQPNDPGGPSLSVFAKRTE